MTFYLIAVLTVVPAIVSIIYLLPEASWTTRAKALIVRGTLKFSFGIIVGFFGIVLLELSRQEVVKNMPLLLFLGTIVYLFFLWLYLYLYKLILNKVIGQLLTWRAIFNALMLEIGVAVTIICISMVLFFVTELF